MDEVTMLEDHERFLKSWRSTCTKHRGSLEYLPNAQSKFDQTSSSCSTRPGSRASSSASESSHGSSTMSICTYAAHLLEPWPKVHAPFEGKPRKTRSSSAARRVSDPLPCQDSSSRPSSGGRKLLDSRTSPIWVNADRFFDVQQKVNPAASKVQKTRSSSTPRRMSDPLPRCRSSKGSRLSVPAPRHKELHDALPWLPGQQAALQEKASQELFEKDLLFLSMAAGVSPPKAGTSKDPLMSCSPSPQAKRHDCHSKLHPLVWRLADSDIHGFQP